MALRPNAKALENFATSYLGAYLSTVTKEKPEHPPGLVRTKGYEIEVCSLPNGCFAVVFSRSDKQTVTVTERDYSYLEEKVKSGVLHVVPIYPGDGTTVADAIARGKEDAVRDIAATENSSIGRAAAEIEKVMEGLESIELGDKEVVQLAEEELVRMEPLAKAAKVTVSQPNPSTSSSGSREEPHLGTGLGGKLDPKDRELLANISRGLEDLNNIVRIVESQERKLEELDSAMKKSLEEFNRNIDERISKGLAVILSASDKKIDKGFAALSGGSRANPAMAFPKELEVRLEKMDKMLGAHQIQIQELGLREQPKHEVPLDLIARLDSIETNAAGLKANYDQHMKELRESVARLETVPPQPAANNLQEKLHEELVLAIAQMKEDVARMNARVIKIEDFLNKISGPQAQAKVRVLKQK